MIDNEESTPLERQVQIHPSQPDLESDPSERPKILTFEELIPILWKNQQPLKNR